MKKVIFISGDHAGFQMKEKIKKYLKNKDYSVEDFGPLVYDKNDDYPDFVIPMAKEIIMKKKENVFGVVIAGSGEGEAIAINRYSGIRAAVYHGGNLKVVKTAREHNNANVLCIGARFASSDEIKKAVDIFLKTKFKGGRHLRRLKKIEAMV